MPSTESKGVGRTFDFAIFKGSFRTGFAVFAYEDATVQVYELDSENLFLETTMSAGDIWWNAELGTGQLRLESSGDVEAWAGSTEGPSEVQGLGDDICVRGRAQRTRDHYVHSLWDGSVISCRMTTR